MEPTPINFSQPSGSNGSLMPGAGRPLFGQASTSAMSMKWSALHDAAGVVATLAGIAPEPMSAELRNFPSSIRDAGGWRREMADQGIADMASFMEPGLSALLAAHARGTLASAAALALYQEFHSARKVLLELVPAPSPFGPMRSA